MYRVPAAVCAAVLSCAPAQASSILTLPETGADTPSIVALGSAEPPTLEGIPVGPDVAGDDETNPPQYRIGGSIVAFGTDAIPAAPVAFASIEPEADEEPALAPMPFVIRGGVIGDAFSAPPAEALARPEEPPAGDPAAAGQPFEQPG